MDDNNNNLAEDMMTYFYPNGMSRWDKFFEYVLPWLIFIGIIVGLYFSASYILQGMFILSEPLAELMREAGL